MNSWPKLVETLLETTLTSGASAVTVTPVATLDMAITRSTASGCERMTFTFSRRAVSKPVSAASTR